MYLEQALSKITSPQFSTEEEGEEVKNESSTLKDRVMTIILPDGHNWHIDKIPLKVFPTIIANGTDSLHGFNFYDFSNLSSTGKLKIRFISEGKLIECDLVDFIANNFSEFLRLSLEEQREYDSWGFINYIAGLKDIDLNHAFENIHKMGTWEALEIVHDFEREIEPGKFVAIHKGGDLPYFALSLGNGVFLSKFGYNGNIILTNLEEIIRFHRGDFAVVMKKNGQL